MHRAKSATPRCRTTADFSHHRTEFTTPPSIGLQPEMRSWLDIIYIKTRKHIRHCGWFWLLFCGARRGLCNKNVFQESTTKKETAMHLYCGTWTVPKHRNRIPNIRLEMRSDIDNLICETSEVRKNGKWQWYWLTGRALVSIIGQCMDG